MKKFTRGQRVYHLTDPDLIGTIIQLTTLGVVVDYDCNHHERNQLWYKIKWDNGIEGYEAEHSLVRIRKTKKRSRVRSSYFVYYEYGKQIRWILYKPLNLG